MENKTKIRTSISLFIFIFISLSCNNVQVRNPELCFKTNEGDWHIKTDDSKWIKEVITDSEELPVSEIIDFRTFDYLYKYKDDSIKFNNTFYSHNPSKVYFKDKRFLYFLVNDSSGDALLYKKCKSNEYELIGGEYLKIFPNVYWQTKKINNADYQTFKTMNVSQNKSEWGITIGIDKNNIYYGADIITKTIFETLYWTNKDSLKIHYHY